MKRAVAYQRISTIGQMDGTGLEFQKSKLDAYVKYSEMNLVKTIEEVGSGANGDRDGLNQIKSMVENNEVDVVLVWNVSRGFRSMVVFANFYDFLNKHDVELISVSEGVSSKSKSGELLFSVLQGVASFEKSVITERMMSGRLTRAKQGIRAYGKKLYGYDLDWNLVEDEASVIKYIYKKTNAMIKKGYSKTKRSRHLLKLLRNKGLKFKNHYFKSHNIRDILSNEFYVGKLKYSNVETKHNYQTIVSQRLYNSVNVV
tara:strand:- start:907 stop:1680 length:774 start_codon:yes stop_codon:yes gene_type:complete